MNEILRSGLVDHLWQSTLFAVVAALLAQVVRNNRAHLRHWIWFAASVKFLVPFAVLWQVGSQVGARLAPSGHTVFYVWAEPELNPGAAIPAAHLALRPESLDWAGLAVAVWLGGLLLLVVYWWRAWRRIRAIVDTAAEVREGVAYEMLLRMRRQAGVRTPVVLMATETSLEPCVFGIFRPVLLLPRGILDYLRPGHLEAIVAHELSHVRRWDNLATAIQSVVQALFWFHPLVWWLRSQSVKERERACDEDVLRLGTNPRVYAEGIVRVCRCLIAPPRVCVSGVAGADLRARVERIMMRRVGTRLGLTKGLLLAGSALGALMGPVVTGAVAASEMNEQVRIADASTLPAFAFATVKPSLPDTRLSIQFAPGGRLIATHATLRFLMKIAYDIGDRQILGGPAWLESKRFDVEAKPETPFGGDPKEMTGEQRRAFQEQVRLRLQRLLAEKFQLRLRSEAQEMPVFGLVVAKNGPKLVKSAGPGAARMAGGQGRLEAVHVDMDTFARFLGEGHTGRPVVNRTGLEGAFDFRLQWSPDAGQRLSAQYDPNASPAAATGPSIFSALQQQLGLKLEAEKSPADCVVVEAAQIPAAQ